MTHHVQRGKPLSKPKSKQNNVCEETQQDAETISATQTETGPITQKQKPVKSQFSNSTGLDAMHELVTNLVSALFYLR